MSEEKEFAPLAPSIGAEGRTIRAAFERTGIKWTSEAAALAKFKEGGREVIIENGQAFTYYDRETLPLEDALTRWAYDNRDSELFDGRSLPRNGAGLARPGLLSKADMTRAEKVTYVNTHGEDAFARLATKGVGPKGEVKTFEDWKLLPRAEKVRRTNANPNIVNELIRASKAR
jgi:hypothetical protein